MEARPARGYLGHKAKATTKIRNVMDGAARYRGKNINDLLAPGSNLIADLPAILVRMCFKPVALTGDISQMFLCIHLPLEDRKYH